MVRGKKGEKRTEKEKSIYPRRANTYLPGGQNIGEARLKLKLRKWDEILLGHFHRPGTGGAGQRWVPVRKESKEGYNSFKNKQETERLRSRGRKTNGLQQTSGTESIYVNPYLHRETTATHKREKRRSGGKRLENFTLTF